MVMTGGWFMKLFYPHYMFFMAGSPANDAWSLQGSVFIGHNMLFGWFIVLNLIRKNDKIL